MINQAGETSVAQHGETQQSEQTAVQKKNKGLGRILVAVYGVFALSAFARALFQVLTEFSVAPVAFVLSAVAAAVYIVATIALAISGVTAWRVAMTAVVTELVGMLVVSILSYTHTQFFPKASVWSHFGQGYGYVPLVLPVIGVWWLWAHRPRPRT